MRIAVAFILILVLRCGAATTWNTNTVCEDCTGSIGSTYASLALWEDARDGNLVTSDYMEVCMIIGAWTTNDITAVDFNGSTTDSTHFMLVYTTGSARHKGVFSTNQYFLSVNGAPLDISDPYVYLDGLQVEEVATGSSSVIGSTTGGTSPTVKNCLVRCNSAGTTSHGITFTINQGGGLVINCLIDLKSTAGVGLYDSAASGSGATYYNCTVICSAAAGARQGSQAVGTTYTNLYINCIFKDFSSNYIVMPHVSSGYNSTTANHMYVLGDSGKTGDRLNQTFTFVSSTDYHLSGVDAGARTYGTNLSGIFTTDFDGETRIAPWDIGADQTNATAAVSTRKAPFLRGFRR